MHRFSLSNKYQFKKGKNKKKENFTDQFNAKCRCLMHITTVNCRLTILNFEHKAVKNYKTKVCLKIAFTKRFLSRRLSFWNNHKWKNFTNEWNQKEVYWYVSSSFQVLSLLKYIENKYNCKILADILEKQLFYKKLELTGKHWVWRDD